MVNDKDKVKILPNLGLIVNFLALAIAIYGLFKEPKIADIIFLISILIFIAFYYVVSYFIRNFLGKLEQIEKNRLAISDIQKDLNKINDNVSNMKEVAKLSAKVSFLEKILVNKMKNKKSQIDPRWVILLIIILLLILYARSQGWI